MGCSPNLIKQIYQKMNPSISGESWRLRPARSQGPSEIESPHKGDKLEIRVLQEAEDLGHAILIFEPFESHTHGFDVVSYDTKNGVLHIWEAKDYHGKVGVQNLGTILNAHGTLTNKQANRFDSREEAEEYAEDRQRLLFGEDEFEGTTGVLGSVPSELLRERIIESISSSNICFHLRGSSTTEYTTGVEQMFSHTNYDVKNYD